MKIDWYITERKFHNPVIQKTEQPVSEHMQDSAWCVLPQTSIWVLVRGHASNPAHHFVLAASIPAVCWLTAAPENLILVHFCGMSVTTINKGPKNYFRKVSQSNDNSTCYFFSLLHIYSPMRSVD